MNEAGPLHDELAGARARPDGMPIAGRLNLGCGTDIRPGWVNLDSSNEIPGVDVVHDLNRLPLPFPDEAFECVLAQDVLEHLPDPVGTLRDLHRILKPGGRLRIRVPHFTSRNNFIDPTHRTQFSIEWFDFFVRGSRRQRERPYYFDFSFSRLTGERITFERTSRWTAFNPLIDWVVNRSRSFRVGYELTFLRSFPADNIICELEK